MVNKILFWTGFGLLTRFWQLGIEMRPFHRQLWAYGIYGGVGAGFGYWLQGVEQNQLRYLRETRDRLLEKRARRAEREGQSALQAGTDWQREKEGLLASPTEVVRTGIEIPEGKMVERTEAAQ